MADDEQTPADEAPEEEPQAAAEESASEDGAAALEAAPEEAAASVADSPPLAEQLGAASAALAPLAAHAAEVLSVAVESVLAHKVEVLESTAVVTDYARVEREFADLPHMGSEIRVALSPTEAHLVAALIPLEDAGLLFGVETGAEQMDDVEFAAAQIATVSQQARELLDLVSITLFTEGLAGAEATLAELRVGQIDFTMGVLADVAQGAPAGRLDVTLILPDSSVAHLTLVIPVPLLERLAELAAPGAAATAPEEAGARPPLASIGFDRPDDTSTGGNVSPLRPAPAGGGVPVNPVAFPPLPAMESIGQGQSHPIDLILDVSMRVTVELGRSSMTVEEVLALGPGSVVELNKLAGEPVDILVNERLIARGEVVVVDENFGVRVTEIVSPRRRAHAIGAA
jgi:flagellar motor switch protein FliN/FliY